MGDTVDPITVLQVGGPGMAMHSFTRFSDSGRLEVTWLLRVASEKIRQIPDSEIVEVRADVFHEDPVYLIPVLIRIDSTESEESIFETWINIHQQGENPLTLLADQDRIMLQLYGDSLTVEKILEIPNTLQTMARTTLADLSTAPSWTLREFESARNKLCDRSFPSALRLWHQLTKKPE